MRPLSFIDSLEQSESDQSNISAELIYEASAEYHKAFYLYEQGHVNPGPEYLIDFFPMCM